MIWTEEQIQEYMKCRDDFSHFMLSYGITNICSNFDMLTSSKNPIIELSEDVDYSTMIEWFIVWRLIFIKDEVMVILCNKQNESVAILDRIKEIYKLIPEYIVPRLLWSSKKTLQFENRSMIFVGAASPSTICGLNINLLYLPVFTDVNNKRAEEVIQCVFPVIQSSRQYKKIIVSGNSGGNISFDKLLGHVKNELYNYEAVR